MFIVKPEKRFFEKQYADFVDNCANYVNGKHAAYGVKYHVVRRIHSGAVKSVPPQPLAHYVAVVVNQQYAEAGGRNSVDELALLNV